MSLERSSAVLCAEKESRGLPRKAGALSGEVLSRRVSALFFFWLPSVVASGGPKSCFHAARSVICVLGTRAKKGKGSLEQVCLALLGFGVTLTGSCSGGYVWSKWNSRVLLSRNGSLPRRRLAFLASECCILFEEGLLAKSALAYSNYFGVLRLFGRRGSQYSRVYLSYLFVTVDDRKDREGGRSGKKEESNQKLICKIIQVCVDFLGYTCPPNASQLAVLYIRKFEVLHLCWPLFGGSCCEKWRRLKVTLFVFTWAF